MSRVILQPARQQHRRGFTLVEMLVVVAVIAILAAMVAVATLGLIGDARETATKEIIQEIQGLLQQRIDAFNRLDLRRKEVLRDPVLNASYYEYANHDPELAKVLTRKGLFRYYFPQTWKEVDSSWLTALGLSAPSPPNPATESAEVLYFLLTNAPLIGYTPVGTDNFRTQSVRDTDGNGFPEFLDGWEQPLRFYRWPTRLIKPNGTDPVLSEAQTHIAALPTNPEDLNLDADDPLGLTDSMDPAEFEKVFHTPETWHLPLIVSGGADKDTGLYEPGDSDHFGRLARPRYPDTSATDRNYLHDNITNLNVNVGGN